MEDGGKAVYGIRQPTGLEKLFQTDYVFCRLDPPVFLRKGGMAMAVLIALLLGMALLAAPPVICYRVCMANAAFEHPDVPVTSFLGQRKPFAENARGMLVTSLVMQYLASCFAYAGLDLFRLLLPDQIGNFLSLLVGAPASHSKVPDQSNYYDQYSFLLMFFMAAVGVSYLQIGRLYLAYRDESASPVAVPVATLAALCLASVVIASGSGNFKINAGIVVMILYLAGLVVSIFATLPPRTVHVTMHDARRGRTVTFSYREDDRELRMRAEPQEPEEDRWRVPRGNRHASWSVAGAQSSRPAGPESDRHEQVRPEPSRPEHVRPDLSFLDADQENAGDDWYRFDPGDARTDPVLAVMGFSAWNRDRFEFLRKTPLSEDLLEAIAVPMGFVGACSTASEDMQRICFDEIFFNLGLDEDRLARANQLVDRGRNSKADEIRALASLARGMLENLSFSAPRYVFSAVAAILFYDETLSVAERKLFYLLARYYGLEKSQADGVFGALAALFSLRLRPGSGEYVYSPMAQAAGGGAWGSGGDAGMREDELFRQREEERLRREEEERRRQEEERRRQREEERSRQEQRGRRRWWWSGGDDPGDEPQTMSLSEAYLTIQCGPGDSDADLKTAYRRLVARYHPDRAVSRGAGPEEMARFNELTARVNAAWKVIKDSRPSLG